MSIEISLWYNWRTIQQSSMLLVGLVEMESREQSNAMSTWAKVHSMECECICACVFFLFVWIVDIEIYGWTHAHKILMSNVKRFYPLGYSIDCLTTTEKFLEISFLLFSLRTASPKLFRTQCMLKPHCSHSINLKNNRNRKT